MAEIRTLMETVEDFTEKEENSLIRQLTQQYALTYKEARQIILEFGTKVTEDGKIDPKEAVKYKRRDKLIEDIILVIGLNSTQINRLTDKFLKSSYRNNLQYTSYVLEGATGIGKLVQPVPIDAINEVLHTDLDKISIQNNAAQVRANIKRDITAGIQQGQTPQQVAIKVKKSLEKNANNALRIAQTESTRIKNNARFTAMQNAEARGADIFKIWNARLDRRTRPSHVKINDETRPLDEPFSNGLMYPGDETGPPEEVINCRCELEFITSEGETLSEEYVSFTEWKKS